jgi:tetratricopeptide (TPR) repeat protein
MLFRRLRPLWIAMTLGLCAIAPAPAQEPSPAMTFPGHGAEDPGRDPALAALAQQPWRPEWAPLPLLRGQAAPVATLRGLLSSGSPEERARSCFLLGQLGDSAALRTLRTCLADPSRTVRVQAGIALASLGDSAGVPACEATFAWDAPWVRLYAVRALWGLGTDAARAALERHQTGQEPLVAHAIAAALETPTVAAPPAGAIQDISAPDFPTTDIWDQAADVCTAEGDWWWHQGDYDQAIRCHEAALFFDPTYTDDYAVIAWLQWSLGRPATAIRVLNRGVAAAPQDPNAYFNLGHHYFNIRQYDAALGPLRRAVELGGDILCRRTYAHCLEHLGQLQAALAQWDEILRIDPTDGVARINRQHVAERLAAPAAP